MMQTVTLNRREALRISLATSALLLIAGYSVFRNSESDLDKAFQNLSTTIDSFAGDADQQARLISIAERIEKSCRDLTSEHDAFIEQFEAEAQRRDTSASVLDEIVEGFGQRRTVERDQLLRIQDELRAELTEQEWTTAVEALDQTRESYTRPKIGSS
jgi:hypothetical protein